MNKKCFTNLGTTLSISTVFSPCVPSSFLLTVRSKDLRSLIRLIFPANIADVWKVLVGITFFNPIELNFVNKLSHINLKDIVAFFSL